MTRSTTIYIGGDGYTLGQLIGDMKNAPLGSLIPQWRACQILRAMIQLGEFPQDICDEMNSILKKKGEPPITVGSLNNQQVGLVCPSNLTNHIFDECIDLKRMWEWIRDHFLPVHVYEYDWFALLRFLADKQLLSKGIRTSNKDFAIQMNEWFRSYSCTDSNVKIYRTGYLGATPYYQWDYSAFLKQKRKNQKVEGFNHLHKICNSDLVGAFEEDCLLSKTPIN